MVPEIMIVEQLISWYLELDTVRHRQWQFPKIFIDGAHQ